MGERIRSNERRQVIGGVAAGVAAYMAAPVLAQAAGSPQKGSESSAPAPDAPETLRDPREGFPRPPFKWDPQPWPGLASKMSPRPDHGEDSYRGAGRLAGRKALITGGDSGIGRAAAIAYAREGADVAINYLPAEEPDAREVVALIQAAGRKAVPLPGDIRDEGFCQKLVDDAVRGLGGLDILVNNAAFQRSLPSFLDLTTEQLNQTFHTNVYAMVWITKAAVPHLPPGATIINTSSVNAEEPGENILDYAMTKAAIANFSRGLAKQLASKGIRVNAVAPGPFWTPLQVSGGQSEENLRTFGEKSPMGRPGQPVELAPLYVQLASAATSYTTGQVHGVNGGLGLF